MPRSSKDRQAFNTKKPFFVVAAFVAALGVWSAGLFYSQVTGVRNEGASKIAEKVSPLAAVETNLKSEETKIAELKEQVSQLSDYLHERTYWPEILVEVRRILLEAEASSSQKVGVPVGIWVDSFYSTEPVVALAESGTEEAPKFMSMNMEMMRRYGLIKGPPQPGEPGGGGPGGPSAEGATEGAAEGAPRAPKAKAVSTNEVSIINLKIRAVNLQKIKQEANGALAYTLQEVAKASPLFDASGTELSGNLDQVEDTDPSFTFPLKLKLKRPIKL
jgi:hypothetical protein